MVTNDIGLGVGIPGVTPPSVGGSVVGTSTMIGEGVGGGVRPADAGQYSSRAGSSCSYCVVRKETMTLVLAFEKVRTGYFICIETTQNLQT